MKDPGKQEEHLDLVVDAGRRKAMQKIALGVGVLAGCSVLPEQWTKPIIGQIVLPAHAGTSGSTLNDPCRVEVRLGTPLTNSVHIRVTGFVTPPVANLSTEVTATATGGGNEQAQTTVTTADDGTFVAFLRVDGGPGITRVDVETTVKGASGTAHCFVLVKAQQVGVN
jgi:hypothetical protein